MKRIFFNTLLFLLCTPMFVWAQSGTDDIVVGNVGNEQVTYSELKKNINSGNSSAPTLGELEEFLPVYLDYKAKLKAAEDEGYYQDSALIEEHKSYAKQAAYAQWLQKEIKPSAFEKYYERSNVELKTFHILIAAQDRTLPAKVEEIMGKLEEAKAEIENGAALSEVNEKYSTVRNGRSMGGDIPWISAGRTVSEFEDAAYSLEPGEISEPVKTQFGYHIILLQDKRERTPARLTSHIFVRGTQDDAAYTKINEAYSELEEGKNWNEVLQSYTEDGNSKQNAGKIGWISYQANFAPDFVDAIVALDPEETYSEPVQTNYGYHIFKIDSVETYVSEQEKKDAAMQNFEKSTYYEENNDFAVQYLKRNLDTKTFDEPVEEYAAYLTELDTLNLSGAELPSSSLADQPVYTFNGTTYLVSDFHAYLKDQYAQRKAGSFTKNWFNNFTDYVVDENIIALTKETFPGFKEQSQSYRDGLVVYQINDDKVWSSATVDTTRLVELYEANPDDYTFSERPFYYLITAASDSLLNKAKGFVEEGNHPDSLRKNINGVRVRADSTNSYTEAPYNRLSNLEAGSFSEIFEHNNRRAIFWLKERLPARKMTFDEAFNRLMAEYQPIREQEWLQQIRDKYSVETHLDALRSAYQQDS